MSRGFQDGDRLLALLRAALELTDNEGRIAFLARECEDADLRLKIETLLAAEDDALGLFEKLAGDLGLPGQLENQEAPDFAGRIVGQYRLLELLGRGGMGVVWLAERADGAFEQQVAVKLLAMGMTGPQAQARFLAERQILAGLEHPSIARLLDGGVTEDGTPYFVMERVEGERIDHWCDASRIDLAGRMRLMVRVCESVEAAHRKLIVHRDIKPANILVDAKGRPRLLDFGVAKILADVGTDLTLSRFVPLTPTWAAPEQIAGEPVTTATDTRALGALLYLLLTGVPPYDVENLSPTALHGRLSTEAPMASRRFAALGADEQVEIAAARNITPSALLRALDGDIAAILARALALEPERRYGRATELSADLENYLDGRPVTARTPSVGYRMGKFVRRHRVAVMTAVAFVAVLIGALVSVSLEQRETAQQRNLAEIEAAKATQVYRFAMDLFRAADPRSGPDITARQLLEVGLERIDELDNEPEVQANILSVMANSLMNLGGYEAAASAWKRILDILVDAQGPEGEDVAIGLTGVGMSLSLAGDYDEAERYLLRALELDELNFPGEDNPNTLAHLREIAKHYRAAGRLDESERHARNGLAMAERMHGPNHDQVDRLLVPLADTLKHAGKTREARDLYERALEHRLSGGNRVDALAAECLRGLGDIALASGDLSGAEAHYQGALEIREQIFAPEHRMMADNLAAFGNLRRLQGRFNQAEDDLLRALEMFTASEGEASIHRFFPLLHLGQLEQARGNPDRAEAHLHAAIDLARHVNGDAGFRVEAGQQALAELSRASSEF